MIVLDTKQKDDDFDGSRKYDMSSNDDGTISLEDRTAYKTKGNDFGALEVNAIHAAIMGFTSSDAVIAEDGSVLETDAYGRKKKTEFSKDEDGNDVITEILYDTDASVLGSKTTTISKNKKNIKEVAAV